MADNSRVRSKRWTYTVHNIGEWVPHYDPMEVDYMCAQVERGDDTGRVHWQGYVRFKRLKTMKSAKNYLGRDDAHMSTSEGNEAQNRAYCTKDDTHVEGTARIEYGTYDAEAGKKHQGRRSDLSAVYDMVKEGHSFGEIARVHPGEAIKFHSGIDRLISAHLDMDVPLKRELHTTVLWGGTGVGKSHRANMAFPDAYSINKYGRDPFSKYVDQQVVIFHEWKDNWELQDMLSWLDVWKCMLDCRYNDKYARWNHVVITTNKDPSTWYPHEDKVVRDALVRRISAPMGRVYEIKDWYVPEVNFEWWKTDS